MLRKKPALSEAEGVGFHESSELGILHLLIGGAAVYRCDSYAVVTPALAAERRLRRALPPPGSRVRTSVHLAATEVTAYAESTLKGSGSVCR
jgi:hypothetical protein